MTIEQTFVGITHGFDLIPCFLLCSWVEERVSDPNR